MTPYIVTGTDTDAGKTLVSALLVRGLKAHYWKPIQSGTQDSTDTQTVKRLSALPDTHFFPEVYNLQAPLSPHRAAELENVEIDAGKILSVYHDISHSRESGNPPLNKSKEIPAFAGMISVDADVLIIEGAGGLLVPITRRLLQIDLFKQLDAPLILVARTGLGTINHTLLSIEAIRARGLALHGIIFSGPDNPDNIRTIADFSGAKILGRVPQLAEIAPHILEAVFVDNFNRADFK